jgi:hypothetical protein
VKPTVGTGSSGTEGDGPQGVIGLLITVAFAYIFVFVFLPESARDWFVPLFIVVEVGAAVLYVVADRRSRAATDRMLRDLHQINEKTNH